MKLVAQRTSHTKYEPNEHADSQTSSQAALSDLRPASDLRENYTLFLNEFQDSQTVKFDFGHKIGAIDLQQPHFSLHFGLKNMLMITEAQKDQPTHN